MILSSVTHKPKIISLLGEGRKYHLFMGAAIGNLEVGHLDGYNVD